jgi:hypothetical protein
MGSKPKQPKPAAPPPVPTQADATIQADQLAADQRRKRTGFLGTIQAGQTLGSGGGGNAFLS